MPEVSSPVVTFVADRLRDKDAAQVSCWIGDGGVRIVGGFGGWDTRSRPRKTALTLWEGYEPLTLEIPVIFLTRNRNDFAAGREVEAEIVNLGMMAGRGEPTPEPKLSKKGKITKYRVKRSDKRYAQIAHKLHVSLQDLLILNNIRDPGKRPKRGRKLLIPEVAHNQPFGQPPSVRLQVHPIGSQIIPYNDVSIHDDDYARRRWVIQNIDFGKTLRNRYGDRIRQDATVTVLQYVPPRLVAIKATPWRRSKRKKKK